MAEHSRKVYRVLKTATESDFANLLLTRAPASQQAAGALQTPLADIIGHGLAARGEHTVEMSPRTVEVPGYQLWVQTGEVRCRLINV